MHKPKRQSFNMPGHAHFLTFSCYQRFPVFSNEFACNLLAETIDQARDILKLELLSYVFMPDHVHMLIRPQSPEYSIPQILKSIKGPFAKKLIDKLKSNHDNILNHLEISTSKGIGYRVWERGGGFDRNLYSNDKVCAAITYIEQNPVRKGLVSETTDWMWSSAGARTNDKNVPLLIESLDSLI